MSALVRYTAANVVLSQRYLPPVLLFLAFEFVFTGADDNGPLPPAYAVGAAGVFVCGVWLTIVAVNAEDPVQRSITAVNAGGSGRVLLASVWVALVACLVLGIVGLGYPLLTGHHVITVSVLVLGALAELTSACTGVAIGLLCSRPVVRRTGYAVLGAVAAILLFLLVPGLPPVNPVFRLLAGTRPPAAQLLPVALFGAVSVVLAVASTVLTRHVAQRKD